MATIVTRTANGAALSTAQMDANLTNLNNDKIEALSDDSSPSLSANLDLTSFEITTTTSNGNIKLSPNGTGLVWANSGLRVSNGVISVDTADTNLSLTAGSGTGSILLNDNTYVYGDGTDATVSSGNSNENIKITANGTGKIVLDASVDLLANAITTSTTNQNIVITNNGTGSTVVSGGAGIAVSSGYVSTTADNTDLTFTATGTGVIVMNQAAGVVVTETASSGQGVITGNTSTGLALLTNAGASGATDPSVSLTSGGGASLSAGTGSTLTLTGNALTVNGDTTFSDGVSITTLNSYAEELETISSSGTLTIDPTTGPIKYVVPTGNITITGFSSPVAGQTVSFLIDNSTYATSYTLTLGAAILVPGGTAPSLTASGNDLLTITCIDSATPVYIANVVNDFQ